MNKYMYKTFICCLVFSCLALNAAGQNYLRWVGDIAHDPAIDGDSFSPCHGDSLVYQYFNLSDGLQYEGEKAAIDSFFLVNYQSIDKPASGWIRIRFIVNCQGETGRFRLLESDENFNERPFDKSISDQIVHLSKALNGWKIISYKGTAVDYYQYLSFKIENGQIVKILP